MMALVSVLLVVAVVEMGWGNNIPAISQRDTSDELYQCSSSFLRSRFFAIERELQTVARQIESLQNQLPQKYCPFGFEYLPEIEKCLKLVLQKMTWDNARETCRSLVPGAQLAAITNVGKQEAVARFLRNEFIKPESAACFLSVWPRGGKVAWISGQTQDPKRCRTPYFWKPTPSAEIPFTYTNWIPGEPDCWNNAENCVLIAGGLSYGWNDGGCHLQSCSVCEL